MIRSLVTKLTLAFILVGLTGALLVAFIVRQQTRRQFDRLVVSQNQQALINNLTRYYEQYGTWEGVSATFRPRTAPGVVPEFESPEVRDQWEARRVLFNIAGKDGVILYGNPENLGRQISRADLERHGTRLEVEGETVGWLIFAPLIDRWRPGTPEGEFLISTNRAIYLSAGIAILIAILLGGFLAYTLTRSLRELTSATQELAQGKLGRQVNIHSRDELGTLANSFNQMSTALADANRLRRQMTADIAHDLRNPLSVILGYTEALSDGKLQGRPETFKTMHIEAQQLSRLIEDLKTLSLADAGELPLVFQQVNPVVLLRRAVEAYRIQADEQGIQLELQAPPDLPPVKLDVERMAQVLGNLVSNALRHTPRGGLITLSAVSRAGDVFIQVKDNGSGIAPHDLPHIFDRSYRGDKARQAAAGEAGLGLAIVRSLVEAQGGSITAASELGAGSIFTIQIPVR